VHVDAVEEGARELRAVACDLVRRATAPCALVVTEVAARAGVHRRDELKARGEFGLAGGARHQYPARLERLAQHLEHAPVVARPAFFTPEKYVLNLSAVVLAPADAERPASKAS